jgi:hypothetical protein
MMMTVASAQQGYTVMMTMLAWLVSGDTDDGNWLTINSDSAIIVIQ